MLDALESERGILELCSFSKNLLTISQLVIIADLCPADNSFCEIFKLPSHIADENLPRFYISAKHLFDVAVYVHYTRSLQLRVHTIIFPCSLINSISSLSSGCAATSG